MFTVPETSLHCCDGVGRSEAAEARASWRAFIAAQVEHKDRTCPLMLLPLPVAEVPKATFRFPLLRCGCTLRPAPITTEREIPRPWPPGPPGNRRPDRSSRATIGG